MKKRISFNIIIPGKDGPTAARISISLQQLRKAALIIAVLAAGSGMLRKKYCRQDCGRNRENENAPANGERGCGEGTRCLTA